MPFLTILTSFQTHNPDFFAGLSGSILLFQLFSSVIHFVWILQAHRLQAMWLTSLNPLGFLHIRLLLSDSVP